MILVTCVSLKLFGGVGHQESSLDNSGKVFVCSFSKIDGGFMIILEYFGGFETFLKLFRGCVA